MLAIPVDYNDLDSKILIIKYFIQANESPILNILETLKIYKHVENPCRL